MTLGNQTADDSLKAVAARAARDGSLSDERAGFRRLPMPRPGASQRGRPLQGGGLRFAVKFCSRSLPLGCDLGSIQSMPDA